jgi:hypothetical protein
MKKRLTRTRQLSSFHGFIADTDASVIKTIRKDKSLVVFEEVVYSLDPTLPLDPLQTSLATNASLALIGALQAGGAYNLKTTSSSSCSIKRAHRQEFPEAPDRW